MIAIRILVEDDAAAFRGLRTRALIEHPEAFFSTVEEERPLSVIQQQLRDRPGGSAIFGAFDGDALVGTIGIRRETFRKGQHKAIIWGMYVAPECRRRGLARSLVQRALEHARSLEGVSVVQLTVTAGNAAARALYEAEGFTLWGVEPDALRVETRSYAEEHFWRST